MTAVEPPGRYAAGGLIAGSPMPVRIERTGSCVNGHCLYSINGGASEHIVPAAEVQAGDWSQLNCGVQDVLPPEDPS